MKNAFLLIFLICFLTASSSARSQPSEPDSVYVICASDSNMDYAASPVKTQAPMSDYSDIELRGGCIEDVMDAIKANFQSAGVEFIASTAPTARTPTALIDFTLDGHGTPLVTLSNLPPSPTDDFSLISAHPSSQFMVYITFPAARQGAAALISAILLYSIGRCDLALPYFDQAAKSRFPYDIYGSGTEPYYSPIFKDINFYRAGCDLRAGDYEEARHRYEFLIRHDPYLTATNTRGNLAWVYFQLGEEQRAFSLLSKPLEINQVNPYLIGSYTVRQLLTKRSQLYALAFRYTEAIADMDAAIALDPDNPALYVERGQRIILTYDWDRALADYNYALELDPTYSNAYYYRGILYTSVPEGSAARRLALADFQRYLELSPEGVHAADAARYAAELQAQLDALG